MVKKLAMYPVTFIELLEAFDVAETNRLLKV